MMATTAATTTLTTNDSKATKLNKYTTINAISTTTTTTSNSYTSTTTTINPKTTQIPSYQTISSYNRMHKPLIEQFHKADLVPQQLQQHQHQLPLPLAKQYHHQKQHSHLPQPVASSGSYSAANNYNKTIHAYDRSPGANGGIVGIGSGGSSSVSSNSPQSPPSTQFQLNKLDATTTLESEFSKAYKKSSSPASPFVQRKYNNGCSYKYGESPKKDSSMFSSIGQSIMRNLTTSPFSQKKHVVAVPQQNQIDALWRMPTTVTQDATVAFDSCDAAAANKTTQQQSSPLFGRKRYQQNNTTTAVTNNIIADGAIQHQQISLIPYNKNETTNTTKRIQGNQSPIVLQRFYHQQNQLREREIERQQQQPSFQQHSAEVTTTNPFLSSFIPPASHTYSTHLPIASIASSTSSHSSSTQSSNSQYAAAYEPTGSYHQHQHHHHHPQLAAQRSLSPQTTATTTSFGISSNDVAGFRSLQYQPLPQQFMPENSLRQHTTATALARRSPSPSPPSKSPVQEHSNAFVALKHGKLSSRRNLQAESNLSGSSSGIGSGSGSGFHAAYKENSCRDDHHAPIIASNGNEPSASSSSNQRSALPFYRTMSSGGSSSNSISPTDAAPKNSRNFLDNSNCGPPATATSASMFKRFGGGAVAASSAAAGNHIVSTTGFDRRHRSPDPPPRYNRGQSPLVLRKNLLELSGGQPPGSPLIHHRRYVTASPPLPPPRRGSESVPGSPQHFRTRIHYTPEPQRRIYRTIDQ